MDWHEDSILVYWAGDLLKLLDISSEDHILLTTYGKLQPPLGKHRLKVYLLYVTQGALRFRDFLGFSTFSAELLSFGIFTCVSNK